MEFACDTSDQRLNVEYELTYDSVSDQIVDSYGIVWSRKK